MIEFCNEHGIKQIFGLSYSPQSNALAETTNNIIRDVMRALLIKNGSLSWCDHLPEIQNSINDTIADSTARPRSEIFLQGRHKEEVREKVQKRREEEMKINHNDRLEIGDKVRVALSSIQPEIRKKIKENQQKYVIARYTHEIYRVVGRSKPKSVFLRETYKVANIENGEMLDKRFYSNELLRVPEDTSRNDLLTKEKINKLNSIKAITISEPNIIETRNRENRRP